jgi:outer membrane receptor protein involved in Fe transport
MESAATLRGVVLDASTDKPVPGASVVLRHLPDSTLVTGAITRADGGFAVAGIRPGRYVARISGVGYTPFFIPTVGVKPGADTIELGTIRLATSAVNADEVVVNARRDFMTVGADRTVFNTKDLIVSSGGTATDLLKNIPSIEVDADGNVSLRGNQNIAIQLNGRPSGLTADALKSLPADAIERVEIVANPSAKFDPEGIGGIINIVLKQNQDRRLSGGVNGGAGTNGSVSLGANINFGSGPWSVLANYGFTRWPGEGSGTRVQDNLLVSPVTSLTTLDSTHGKSYGHSLNASVDYSLDRQNTISVSTILGLRSFDGPGITDYATRDASGTLLSRSLRNTDAQWHNFSYDNRLDYKWTGSEQGHELDLEVRYSHDQDTNTTDADERTEPLDAVPAALIEGSRTYLKQMDDEYALQLDYARPLWSGARLEAGYKGSWRKIDNALSVDSLDLMSGAYGDAVTGNSFLFDETIHAVYGTLSQDIGTVSLQVGLRGERAMTSFDLRTLSQSFDNTYTSLFPSALVAWRPSDATQIRLSYGKRVNRPRTGQLNPFNDESDRTFRRVGNPYLLPEYAHALELNVTQFVPWGTISINPYFRRTVDAIQRFQHVDTSGVVTATFENFGRLDSYGADITASGRVGEWLSGFANIGLYRMVADASNVESGFTGDGVGWSARANATFSLGWGLDLQGNVYYRAPNDMPGGYMRSHSFSDIALQKHLFDDRGRLGLHVNDPFDQAGFGFVVATDAYRTDVERHWSSRAAMLTFSYIFGTQDNRSRQRQRSSQQQQSGDDDMGGW